MLTIHVSPAEGEPFEYTIETDHFSIGRSTRCDLAVSDRSLSREHLRLFLEGEQWFVEDLGSRNGTRVNGMLIAKPTTVVPGDILAISTSIITIGGSPSDGYEQPTGDSKSIYRAATDIIAESKREISRTGETEDGDLRRAAAQLRVLNDIHHVLDESTTLEQLFDRVLERVFIHLEPQHGAIFLSDDDSLIRVALRSAPDSIEDFPESSSLAREVVDKGLAAIVLDTATDTRFASSESLLDAGVRTLIAAPLLTPEGALGMIVLSSDLVTRQFAEHDMELLVVVAATIGLKMRNLALAEEAAERKRFEREVAIARRIQVALLPPEMPDYPGLEIFGGNTPSRGVSGDYYQLVVLPEAKEFAVVIADVSGKGIGASLLTAYLDALLNAYLGERLEPAEIFNRTSPQMNRKTPVEAFATAFLGIYSSETGVMRYASAGHDPSILVRDSGEVELLNPTGMPLGLMPEAVYTGAETTFDDGDVLVLYTDGITEAAKPSDEMFERERLIEVAAANHRQAPNALAVSIETAVDAFVEGHPYHDDRTLVILKRVE